MQHRMKSREIIAALRESRPFLFGVVQDVFKSTEIIFAAIFISIVISIVGIKAILRKDTGKNISLASTLSPIFFSMLVVLLMLYNFFVPRTVTPGISLLLLSGILVSILFREVIPMNNLYHFNYRPLLLSPPRVFRSSSAERMPGKLVTRRYVGFDPKQL